MPALQKRGKIRNRSNWEESQLRRSEIRKLAGMNYTPAQLIEKVNAYMVEKGYKSVSSRQIYSDLAKVRADFNEIFSEDTEIRARDNVFRLTMLEQGQWEDYERAREVARKEGKNPSPLHSDNIRKTIEARSKIDGSSVQRHEVNGKLSVEHRLQEILAIKPETTDVLELLPDEDYKVTPLRLSADA